MFKSTAKVIMIQHKKQESCNTLYNFLLDESTLAHQDPSVSFEQSRL